MFENVDIHTYTLTHIHTCIHTVDRGLPTANLYYKLTNKPKGSGELKIGSYLRRFPEIFDLNLRAS